jgi:hypothetical protein
MEFGMLRQLDRGIWVAEQPLRYLGLSVGTRMTVVELAERELAVISPVRADQALINQLTELGTVQHIIAPNLYHYLFAADFKALYPNATFWAAPGLDAKRPDLPIDRTIQPEASSALRGLESVLFEGFRTLGFKGIDSLNECVFFHPSSRSLILTDAAFHFDESFPLMTQLATRVMGGYKSLSPSVLERLASTDKQKVKQSVEQILSWDFQRVLMAHGSIIEQDGRRQFRRCYEQFLGESLYAVL